MDPTSHYVNVPGVRLHIALWGPSGARPVILLHGGRDHARAWDAIAKRLSADWRVIVPDLRGHGDSGWSAEGHYAKRDYLEDLLTVAASLNADRSIVVGHSLGANIGLHYAAAFPERVTRLIAIEGMMRSPEEEASRAAHAPARRLRQAIEARAAAAARTSRRYMRIEDAVSRLAEANPTLSLPLRRQLAETGLRVNEDGSFSWKHDGRLGPGPITDGNAGELPALLHAIECPTLLIYGDRSCATRPSKDGRLAAFRNAREVMVEGAGHWVQHDAPDTLVELIRGFLAS